MNQSLNNIYLMKLYFKKTSPIFFYALSIFVFAPLVQSCQKTDDTPASTATLAMISEHNLQILEPSGLCDFFDGTFLSVSDSDGKIYNIDRTGAVLGIIDIQGKSLEGVAFDPSDSIIYTVDEFSGILSSYSLNGTIISSWQIDESDKNNGLEGCSIDTENRIIYMLKEKSPGRLYSFNLETKIQTSFQLDFAEDYSGVFFDNVGQILWIVSDKSKTINKCDLKGDLIISYSTNIKKGEGVVVSTELDRIFVVSDSEEQMFVFELP